MEIRDYLKDEMKRLNRMNDLLEKETNQENAIEYKYSIVENNVLAMCEIAKTLK